MFLQKANVGLEDIFTYLSTCNNYPYPIELLTDDIHIIFNSASYDAVILL